MTLVSTRNLLKSTAFSVAALSSTAAFAQDGSELAGQAAQKMKIAQQLRFQKQGDGDKATEYVQSEETPGTEQPRKPKADFPVSSSFIL